MMGTEVARINNGLEYHAKSYGEIQHNRIYERKWIKKQIQLNSIFNRENKADTYTYNIIYNKIHTNIPNPYMSAIQLSI